MQLIYPFLEAKYGKLAILTGKQTDNDSTVVLLFQKSKQLSPKDILKLESPTSLYVPDVELAMEQLMARMHVPSLPTAFH